ncbi:hypothetical protein B0T17DRAFT_494880 [Bombardia bombarda]|uniref:intramembrane prenyl-peptidase Rce1 n=1 Tax=Bombardia bombarda TaxID=252184 RepID=A0AA39WTI1_9PEZI|nr:hypothetical protein B0T17DRAFT_494880 [Bombardia bombarda]
MPALGDMMSRLNPWHQKGKVSLKDKTLPPPITIWTASTLLVCYALIYFLPFYASPTTRPSPTLARDAVSVIRTRIRFVTASTLLCSVVTYVILARTAGAGPFDVLHMMGLWPLALADSARALFLTALLFAGPLFSYFVVDAGWRTWLRFEPVRKVLNEWIPWRNVVAGPVTEEMLYRSASVPLMLIAQAPVKQTIFLSPVIFGLSHVHHFYEFRLTSPQVPWLPAVLRSAFQLAYTTLFGAYATFIFIRTGSLLAVCAVHAFCNCMGLPQLWGRVQPSSSSSSSSKAALLWTVSYYVLLVAGAVAWYRNLWTLTETEGVLVPESAFSPPKI